MRNLQSGASTNTKFRSTDSVEFCHMESLKREFSYVDGEGYHFMDPETFEDTVLPEDAINILEISWILCSIFLCYGDLYALLASMVG